MSLMLSQPRIDVDSPVVPVVVFDPPVVRPGELSTYRLTFNALEESIEWSGQLSSQPPLQWRTGGHGQILAMTGASLQPRTSFNFHVRAPAVGAVVVPAFTAIVYGKTVTIPAARLEVVAAPPPSVAPAQRLTLEIPTNLYVGQSTRLSALFPGLPAVLAQGQAPVQMIGEGLIVDQSSFRAHSEMKSLAPGVGRGPVLVYDANFTPLRTGRLSVFAQSFIMGRPLPTTFTTGQTTITGYQPHYLLLDSDPVEIEVKPLPREGELPGFTGAIGSYSLLGQPELSTNVVRVGEPLRLRIRVRGDVDSDLVRLVPPPPPRVRDWQVLISRDEGTIPQIIQAQGFTTLCYILIPLAETVRATPAIPFASFDANLGLYADLTIPPLEVKVVPGGLPIDSNALLKAESIEAPPEKEIVLSGLAPSPGLSVSTLTPLQRRAWFPLVQLAPAVGFLGLWGWDRRRRYLELHPEVVLRRRARRALRRERRAAQRAARSGDAGTFAARAVGALQAACAPYYPAEPGALVGSDVLAVLAEGDRSGRPGLVIRRVFQFTDASRFAGASFGADETLSLRPELEKVLEGLEARL